MPDDTLNGIAAVQADQNLRNRAAAAISKEHANGFPTPPPVEAEQTAYMERWDWAAQPGWAAAYEFAVAGGNPAPGADPAVVTDGMIGAWVQGRWPKEVEGS